MPACRQRCSPDCRYSSKMAACSVGAMPGPVSVTEMDVVSRANRSTRMLHVALVREFDCVADHVVEDLPQASLIGPGLGAFALKLQLEAFLSCRHLDFANDRLGNFEYIDATFASAAIGRTRWRISRGCRQSMRPGVDHSCVRS